MRASIVIHTGSLDMHNGATMFATTFGSGNAGLININAQSFNLYNGSIITAGTFGSGNGGDVQVSTGSLLMNGLDTLNGGPDNLTGIQAVTTSLSAPAPGGGIHINAGSVELDHMGSVFTTSYGLGSGGNIELTSTGNLTLSTGSTIRARKGMATGSAGTNFGAGRPSPLQTFTGNSAISTSAPGSSGGDISVMAGSQLTLDNGQITAPSGCERRQHHGGGSRASLVYLLNKAPLLGRRTSTARQRFGNGGKSLDRDPSFLILNGGSLISKSSLGNGSNITIHSDYFFQGASLIDATAPFGIPGTVTVTAPNIDLSGALIALPDNLLDDGKSVGARLRGRRLAGGNLSSFSSCSATAGCQLPRADLRRVPRGEERMTGPNSNWNNQPCRHPLVLVLLVLACWSWPVNAQILPPPPRGDAALRPAVQCANSGIPATWLSHRLNWRKSPRRTRITPSPARNLRRPAAPSRCITSTMAISIRAPSFRTRSPRKGSLPSASSRVR